MIRATASDIEALRAALAVAEARAEEAVAKASNAEAIIAALKLMVEKLRREVYGQRSERKARLLDQLELELEELEARASEDELAAEQAAAKTSTVKSFTRRRPSRKPFPEHLPRERVVVPAPEVCGCCGSDRLSKLGEDITETLEVWKVVQTVPRSSPAGTARRSQAPARDPAGWAGPSLLGDVPGNSWGRRRWLMMLCLHDGFNGTGPEPFSSVRISEDGQLAIGLEATEGFLGLQQAGGGPSERHLGVSPAFDVAGDLAHRAERVSTGERAPEFVRQAE